MKYVHYYNLGGGHFWTQTIEDNVDVALIDEKMRPSGMRVAGWDPVKQEGFFEFGPLGGLFRILSDRDGRATIGGFAARKLFENARAHPYGEHEKEMS